MSHTTNLSPDWRNWIVENLARGCDPQSLIADMVRNNFDVDYARAAVLFGQQSGWAAAPVPGNAYVYETPRFPIEVLQPEDPRRSFAWCRLTDVAAFLGSVLLQRIAAWQRYQPRYWLHCEPGHEFLFPVKDDR